MQEIHDILDELKSISLSNNDIKILVPDCVIMLYKDLSKFNNINELFNISNNVVILYETKLNYGHWCCIINRINNYEVFDSYGLFPDEELKFIDKLFRTKNNMRYPYLSYLLLDTNKPIEYNKDQLQQYKKGVNTCGRFVCERIIKKKMNIDEFVKYYKSFKDISFNPDDVVTLETYYV